MSNEHEKNTLKEPLAEEPQAADGAGQEEDKEQEEEEKEEPKRYSSISWLWILIPVFIILFLISCFMLGSLLYNMATIDRYEVDLSNGSQGELELFQIVYDDDMGQIIVEGTTQEDVVAPGTEVHSTLRLQNPTDMSLDYVLTSEAGYYNEFRVPIEVKMTDKNGNYIVGSANTWVSVVELNDLEYKSTIKSGEVDSFGISWRWVYESGRDEDDLYDTFLGNIGGNRIPGVIVVFYTEAVTSPSLSPRHFWLHDGFFCCWCCYLVWLLLILCVILAFCNSRYRRKVNLAADDIEEQEEKLELYAALYGPLPEPEELKAMLAAKALTESQKAETKNE